MEKSFKIFGMTPVLFGVFFTVVMIAHFAGCIPGNTLGAFAMCFALGILLGEIGDRIPIWNEWIGGGGVLTFFGACVLDHYGFFTDKEIVMMNHFMKTTDFLGYFISTLITASVLGLQKDILLKSFVGYVPAILGGVAGASLLGILAGYMFGIDPIIIIVQYMFPIMGGGNGGGAMPLSEIYAATVGDPSNAEQLQQLQADYYSKAMAILTIGNIFAIIGSGILNKLGQMFPKLSGNGILMKSQSYTNDDEKTGQTPFTPQDVAVSIFIVSATYSLARTFATHLGTFGDIKIHYYAYMVIFAILMNIFDVIPAPVRSAMQKVQGFLLNQMLWVLMIGVGVVYTSLSEIIAALTLTNTIISMFIVVGAGIGAGFVGSLLNFYFVETAITAGLCMANRSGSGDIACLTAANRMNLISYAQISTRMGGGIILILSSIFFGSFL